MADEALRQMLESQLTAALGPNALPFGPVAGSEAPRQDEALTRPSETTQALPSQKPTPKRALSPAREPSTKRVKSENKDLDLDLDVMLKNALCAMDQEAEVVSAPGSSMTPVTPDTRPHPHGEQVVYQSIAAARAGDKGEPIPKNVAEKIMKASSSPRGMMRFMSLPVIGNVAVQVLLRLAQQPCAETEALLSQPAGGSEFAETFETLRHMFELARNLFTTSRLLNPDVLHIYDEDDRETVRMANLAAVSLSAFGSEDLALEDVHQLFHLIFMPEDVCHFTKDYMDLLVSLKTHAFLGARKDGEAEADVMRDLDKWFTDDGPGGLQPALHVFGQMLGERRELLLAAMAEHKERFRECIVDRFPARGWMESVSAYLQTHLPVIIDYAEKYGVNIPHNEQRLAPQVEGEGEGEGELELESLSPDVMDEEASFDVTGLADFIAESLGKEQKQAQSVLDVYAPPMASRQVAATATAAAAAADGVLPPNQTEPTEILYERARQAAVNKTTTHVRREGANSTRRPWTSLEERTLMTGLDMVKGPHWSQILALFGRNGTISNTLQDRTQVQLKDKARNLKLFFLKTGCEMPHYLRCVTGELKTRAPGQAARKEAEHKARLGSGDERARIQGIHVLADGLRHPPRPEMQAVVPPQAPGANMMDHLQAALVAAQQVVPPAVPPVVPHVVPQVASAALSPADRGMG